MKSLISFCILYLFKVFSHVFYRFKIGWPSTKIRWNEVRLIVFLNHTSLMEVLFLGFLPTRFLRRLSKRMVAPGADKTLDRPLVGTLFKLFSPGMTKITRKRDDSWTEFLESIYDDAVILIAAEGRMKRKNGLDVDGKKMTVRSGVVDILSRLKSGQMVIAYSGGLHHIQVPGEGLPKLFKDLKINLEAMEIPDYKAMFNSAVEGSDEWRKAMLADLQMRLETRCPV